MVRRLALMVMFTTVTMISMTGAANTAAQEGAAACASAFVLGVGSAAASSESPLYFLACGLGFGWPLVVLPLMATPLQWGITRSLAGSSRSLGRLAGALMLANAVCGIWVDVLPNPWR